MSRVTVRQAVAEFFSPPVIPGLNTVYSGPPRHTPASAYYDLTGAGTKNGAVAYPFVESQHEARYALTGAPNAQNDGKRIAYEVALKVEFASDEQKATDALDAHDTIIDLIVQRLRMDRTLGGAVFQVGEGNTLYGDDIHVASGIPRPIKNTGRIVIWSIVRFTCIEFV